MKGTEKWPRSRRRCLYTDCFFGDGGMKKVQRRSGKRASQRTTRVKSAECSGAVLAVSKVAVRERTGPG